MIGPDEDLRLIGELAAHLFPADGEHASWSAIAESGLLALTLPEARGGAGGGVRAVATVARALGRAAAPVPLVEAALLPGLLAPDLPGLGDGEALYTTALDPGLRLDGGKVTGTARLPALPGARALVAADCPNGPALLLLPEGGAEARLFDGMPALDFDWKGAGAEPLLGGNAAGERIAEARRIARVAVLAETAGAAEAAVSLTRDYLPQRKQFGRALSEMQVLRHRLVDMAIAAQEIEALALNAALATATGDTSEALDRRLSAALGLAARRGRRLAEEAVQLHGGIGVTEEARISHVFRRLIRLGLRFGGHGPLMREATSGGERLLS